MYKQKAIVQLIQTTQNYVLPVNRWAKEQRGITICPTCFKMKRDIYPMTIDIYIDQLAKNTSYNIVFQGPCGIIHNDLLELLKPHLTDYSLGRCFRQDGSAISHYHSIYMRDVIFLRGDRDTEYYICPACRSIGGSHDDNSYVLRSELPEAEIFQTYHDTLFVSESVARHFPWRKFKDIGPFIVPVRDEPLSDDPFPG